MKHLKFSVAAAIVLLIGVGLGHWWASRKPVAPQAAAAAAKQAPKILYYRNPMGAADISATPKKDEMGMDYLPVYAADVAVETSNAASNPTSNSTSNTATKADLAEVQLSADKVQKLGVKTTTATYQTLGRSIIALGRLEVDPRRIRVISPKFEGWIENLNVNDVGQTVMKGQVLFSVYMHDLYDVETAYRNAIRTTIEPNTTPAQYREAELQASLKFRQLERIGATNEELERLQRGGDPSMIQQFRSPIEGVVLEKMALQGMRFMPGDPLFKLADISQLALMVEIPVADVAHVRVGTAVRALFDAYPNAPVEGAIDFIYPSVKSDTRTVTARVLVDNSRRRWPAGLNAQVTIKQGAGRRVVVPESAVIDSGTRQVVLIARGEGRYLPRQVKTGVRADGLIAIESGLDAGEVVVIAANFLLDSESNLQSALRGFAISAGSAAASASH